MNAAHRSRLLKEQMPLADASPYRNSSVSARSRQEPPECVTCGVCCTLPLVVTVPRGDEKRLTEYWEVVVDDVVVDRVIGRDLVTGRCINLEGTLGEKVGCSIYEDRPNICRVFEAGSDRCLEYRRIYGIDPQLSEHELERDLAHFKPMRGGVIADATIDLESESVSIGLAENGSGEMVARSIKTMRVTVGLDRNKDASYDLHRYDAAKEEWLESDFLGLTLDEAREMIAARALEKN
jgi:Fe-S-cluster containining protein